MVWSNLVVRCPAFYIKLLYGYKDPGSSDRKLERTEAAAKHVTNFSPVSS